MNARLNVLLILLIGFTSALSANQESATEVVFPQRLSAQDMLYACNASALSNTGRERQRYCAGFISGVEEAARLLQADGAGSADQKICMPSNVTSRDLRAVYSKYASQYGQALDKPAVEVALQALRGAYPCVAGIAN
ncbi:MAG: hypothetical protein EP297_14675 [Gammaproteobacteria bacterium]|nr:MAG: hypothetical protein EP297_14675 [Gammaproteobacteria bacterium]